MLNADEKQNADRENGPGRFTDKRTDKRIQQHLTNEKDNISAEDISNVQSDVHCPEPAGDIKDDEKVIANKEDDSYNGKEDVNKPDDITPWNVID